jgi:phosphosulfolactate phosphohydrolase-like enzyme
VASPLTVEDLEEGEICELPEVASRTKKNNTIASVLRVNPQPTAQHVVSLQNRISEFPAERLLDQSVEDIIEQPYVEHPVEPTPFLHTLEPLVEQPELEPTIVEARLTTRCTHRGAVI